MEKWPVICKDPVNTGYDTQETPLKGYVFCQLVQNRNIVENQVKPNENNLLTVLTVRWNKFVRSTFPLVYYITLGEILETVHYTP